MDGRAPPGGIFWLIELVDEHTDALARDFREKFGLSVFELGCGVRWDEAVALARGLFRDTSSWLFAELKGWERPLHPLEPVLADSYDLANQKFVKQMVKPYPRWWAAKNRMGGNSRRRRSSAEVRQLLRRD